MAPDALGLSDLGKIISPSDYAKVDSDDCIMEGDSEKIFFLLESKADEYGKLISRKFFPIKEE